RIIDAMGGTIQASGQPGKGSEFVIRIPAGRSGSEPANNGAALAGHSALILSHNLMEAEAIARTIVAHGGNALIARTVEEASAIRAVRTAPFEAVLVDAQLEKAEGLTLKRLRDAGYAGVEAITLIAPNDRGRLPAYRA